MKKIIRIGFILLLLAFFAGGTAYYFIYWPNTQVKDKGIIYIQKGDSFETVLATLQSKGYVENVYTLRKVADWKKYPAYIKSGRYRIQNGMSNNALVNLLRSGNQEAVNFTFHNVRTFQQLAGLVSHQLEMDSLTFLQTVQNPEISRELGFSQENFKAMFIPNTYQLYWNITPRDFVYKMAGGIQKILEYSPSGKSSSSRAFSGRSDYSGVHCRRRDCKTGRIPHHRRRLHKPFEKRYSFSSLSHPQICLGRFYLAENIDQTYRNRFSVQYL